MRATPTSRPKPPWREPQMRYPRTATDPSKRSGWSWWPGPISNCRRPRGVGAVNAAQLLVSGGDNPDRPHSRGRLNRGGDRQANSALPRIAVVHLHMNVRSRSFASMFFFCTS
ncbi:hypothetical protein ACFFX0_28620 [Citricoccus parietis]|uniref:Uncharacterized protein n=1 Tax=Citricoccus parietis TaxID=592307 RepID=A0ABV5G7L4_9MICC